MISFLAKTCGAGNCNGQLISKCPFGIFKSSKKKQRNFSMISALASKKRSNKKSSVRESKYNSPII